MRALGGAGRGPIPPLPHPVAATRLSLHPPVPSTARSVPQPHGCTPPTVSLSAPLRQFHLFTRFFTPRQWLHSLSLPVAPSLPPQLCSSLPVAPFLPPQLRSSLPMAPSLPPQLRSSLPVAPPLPPSTPPRGSNSLIWPLLGGPTPPAH